MRNVPTSVLVLAIIGIVFGAIGLLGMITGGIMYIKGSNFGGPNPVLEAQRNDRIFMVYFTISSILSLITSALLLAGSIGSMMLKRWARGSMLAYAGMSILLNLAGIIFAIVYANPLAMEALPKGNTAQEVGMRTGAQIGEVIGYVVALLGMIYPGCVLFYYTRPHVVAAFNGIFPEPDEDERYRRRRRDEEDDYDDAPFREDDEPGDDYRFTTKPK